MVQNWRKKSVSGKASQHSSTLSFNIKQKNVSATSEGFFILLLKFYISIVFDPIPRARLWGKELKLLLMDPFCYWS